MGTVTAMEPPEIVPRSQTPPYRQIADWLRKGIEDGRWQPDEPLPSENDLIGMFGVARDTVRRAVQLLQDEGLVVIEPRRGVYLKHPE